MDKVPKMKQSAVKAGRKHGHAATFELGNPLM
jgi:hypothetical protein